MIPSGEFRARITDAILADANALGTGTFTLELSQSEFTVPDGGGFTAPNFTGYGAITAADWVDGIDPATADRTLTMLPPAGGLKWTTGDTVNLPQSIFGMRVINAATNETVGLKQFAEPINLTRADQTFFVPLPDFRMLSDGIA